MDVVTMGQQPRGMVGQARACLSSALAGCRTPDEAVRVAADRLVGNRPGRVVVVVHDEVVSEVVGPDVLSSQALAAVVAGAARLDVRGTLRVVRHEEVGTWRLAILDEHDASRDRASVADAADLAAVRTAVPLLAVQRDADSRIHQLERGQLRFAIMAEVQRMISRRAPLQEVTDALVDGAMSLLESQAASIHERIEGDPDHLTMSSWVGIIGEFADTFRRSRLDVGISGQCVREGRVLVTHAYTQLEGSVSRLASSGISGVLAAPVRCNDEVVAALVVSTRDPDRRYGQEDIDTLTAFADQVGLAITDVRTLAERNEALHDPVTGLPGRRLFLDRLRDALAERSSRRRGVTVLFADLDRFKAVNDSLGHHAGDLLLGEAARRLRGAVRDSDLVARLGGDEFAILLGPAEQQSAEAMASRLVAAMRAPFCIEGHEVYVGASVGLVVGSATDRADTVLRNADLAMYRAKRAGGLRVARFEHSMHVDAVTRLGLDVDMRHALADDQLRLAHQPILDLDSGDLVGLEALVRWHHPTRGIVAPMDFIPRAEETGAILPIGAWVLAEACRHARQRQDQLGRPDLMVTVNLSALQFDDPELTTVVERALATSGLDPSTLVLELTETSLIPDATTTASRLQRLRGLGVRVAVDDFGTGYSSLSYLHTLPIDILKLDRTFLPAPGEGRSWALVRTVLRLARDLDMRVIAEGIEDPVQVDHLLALGCDLGQGFHLGRPMGVDELDDWLAPYTAGY